MISRRRFLGSGVLAGGGCLLAGKAGRAAVVRDVPAWSLYAFDNGLNGLDVPTVESKVALVKRLGFSGMTDHFNLHRLEPVVKELDRVGLELVSLYDTPFIEDAPDPRLEKAIRFLAGRRTRIELGLRSREFKASDPAGDERALAWLRRVVDWCGDTGPVVSIYPHKWFWTERVEDGVRLAAKLGDRRLGVNFNLIHWQITPPRRAVSDWIQAALPHLSLVTVCGMGREHASPEVLPLGQGDFDVAGVLRALKQAGYAGPVGLQCYGVRGESAGHLAASMAAWRTLRP